jgi:hypothetical protein
VQVDATLTIDPRFNGPPDSGNGGYTCGMLAQFVEGDAEVTLRLPPPLGRPLAVQRADDGVVRLLDGEALVAEAAPTEVSADAPPPVSADEARRASQSSGFLDASTHPFPTCFVCGPSRQGSDGLNIFAGALAPGRFAATWTPDSGLAEGDGTIPAEIVWGALDCPTSAPVWNDPADPDFRPIVLARLALRQLGPVMAGAEHTIASWPVAVDGRKRHAGAALYSGDGELLAVSRALWIELRPPAAPR